MGQNQVVKMLGNSTSNYPLRIESFVRFIIFMSPGFIILGHTYKKHHNIGVLSNLLKGCRSL